MFLRTPTFPVESERPLELLLRDSEDEETTPDPPKLADLRVKPLWAHGAEKKNLREQNERRIVALILQDRGKVMVKETCRALRISRSHYYVLLKRYGHYIEHLPAPVQPPVENRAQPER